jgi:hypothetical protein
MRRSLAFASLLSGLAVLFATACTEDLSSPEDESGSDEPETSTSNLTRTEKEAICNAIPAPRAWTAEETELLLGEVTKRAVEMKRTNDALIAQRGVGGYVGAGTDFYKALLRNDKPAAAAIIRAKLKPGYDALRVAGEVKGTSCIGWDYVVLKEAYTKMGRANEWTAIERCGRAWDSDGLHVQQALIANGWTSPTLGFVTDENKIPGSAAEVAIHRTFLQARRQGTYYGTPVSKTTMMKNFLPTPGSTTRKDESLFLRVGGASSIGFVTVRGGYHVPLVVPASAVPAEAAPAGAARTAWLAAKTRGEPFILESHLRRQPWDPTNFEIRPLKELISETLSSNVTYATGTILFAPGGDELLE